MSEVKVNKISPRSGTTVTLGDSGDTITISAGATLSGSLNASSLTSGTVPDARITGAYTGITNLTMSGDLTVDTDTFRVFNSGDYVQIGDGSSRVSFLSNSNDSLQIKNGIIFESGSSATNNEIFTYRSNSLIFGTGASESMRIDSSGNLLVGTTANLAGIGGSSTQGVALSSGSYGGLVAVSRSGNPPIIANRQTSDGIIQEFRKDGTTVGDISSNNGSIELNSQGSSLKFSHLGTNVAFVFSGAFGANADNAMNLGSSGSRFKDLYLGGGAFLGGTGTANKLDDYEEGTWTPVINSGTYSYLGYATYTKIGNQCHLHFRIGNFSDTSSATDIQITGMPFTQPSNTEDGVGSAYGERTDVNKPTVCMNSNIIRFRNGFGVSTFDTPLQYSDINNGGDFDVIASVTYETA